MSGKIFTAFVYMIAATIIITSCTKNNSSNGDIIPSTLSFKANGIQYTWNGALTNDATLGSLITHFRDNYTGETVTYLDARDNNAKGGLYIEITSTTLATGTYNSRSTGRLASFTTPATGAAYNNLRDNQTAIIIISKINNGYADGTFTANLYRSSGSTSAITTMEITEGKFSNVKIVQ